MPFVPAPNTVQVNVVYEMAGQEVENTLYYRREAGVGSTELAALVEAVNAFIVDQLLPFLGNTIKLVRLVGVLLDAADSLIYISTTDLPQFGGASGEAAPNNVSVAVSLRTAERGRSKRGRNYIPGIPKDLIDESTVGSGSITAYESAYAGLITIGGDDGFEQVIVSRYSGFTIVDGKKHPTPRTTAVITPVTSAVILDATVDSQRRRLPGRGA